MPHYDTLNYYLEKLSFKCLADVRKKMIKSLIRMKSFYRSKLFGEYWGIIIDGTGLFYLKEKHCENCLVTTVTREENENEEVSKNDCEINAAKRLLERLNKDYPRLPICLQGDALYAAESIMKLCKANHWKYILTQKA